MRKGDGKVRASRGGSLACCVVCGIGTYNTVRGHASCVVHAPDVEAALGKAGARVFRDGVIVTVDYNPRKHRQNMGSVRVRSAQAPLGGRVVVDVVQGDRGFPDACPGNVLRAADARALAALLVAAADEADKLPPLGEPPEAERAPARPIADKREG